MPKKCGPTTIKMECKVCGFCKFLDQDMIHSSGREAQPLYYYYCNHPFIAKEHLPVLLYGPRGGKFIGKENLTPEWCPCK
jgi:hypothetical protein